MDGITLVTGATGLLGNNVLRQLLERGCSVRVLIRPGSDPRPLAGLDVQTAVGNVCDPQAVRTACRGVGRVIHAAAHVHIGRTQLHVHRAVNVEGTRHVAQAARAEGIRMVHVSSTDAAGVRSLREPADEDTPLGPDPPCSYVISKREAERVVREEIARGLQAVIVNPSFMLGPWDWKPSSGRMLLEVARGRGLFPPRGAFSLVDVRDVAAATVTAAERGRVGQRYLLAGETISYLDAWRRFARACGAWPPLFIPPPRVLTLAGWVGDLWGRIGGQEPDVNSAALAVAALPKHYTSRRAREELEFQNRPLEQTIADAWQWFCDHGYASRGKRGAFHETPAV